MPTHTDSLPVWLAWLEQLHPAEIDLGLDRLRAVMARLALPIAQTKVITVAGTNGKGSTATLIAELLRTHGYTVGLYTSPHFLHFNERVVIQGQPVTDAQMVAALHAINQARQEISLTYFEFTTAAALWLFCAAQVEYMVLEVGLGGRLDAVNVVDTDCAVVTSIGLDHMEWLGDNLDSIAHEKAGVARRHKPLLVGPTPCADTFMAVAAQVGAELTLVEPVELDAAGQWKVRLNDQFLSALPTPLLPLPSAVMALQVCAALGLTLDDARVRGVFDTVAMPGRLQRIEWRGRTLWLDVAHNPHAADYVARLLSAKHARWGIILGMLKDKDAAGVVQSLAPLNPDWRLVTLTGSRGQSADELAVKTGLLTAPNYASVPAALAAVAADPTIDPDMPWLICGSFHTVADALHHLNSETHG